MLALAGMINASAQTIDNPIALWVGESFQHEVTGINLSSLSSYSWSSSNPTSLNVIGDGLSFIVKPTKFFSGVESARFDFIWSFGLVGSRQFYFVCKENPVHISPSSMELQINEIGWVTYSHDYNNQYSTAANAGITYSSSNTNVATVTNAGKVVAKGAGTAYIYVHSNLSNDENPPYCIVTVNNTTPADPTVVLPKTMTLNIGDTGTITPTQSPGAGYSLSWTSSNTSIATVNSSGKVTAKKKGTARITAKVNGYNSSDYCDVTVTAIPKSITMPEKNVTIIVGQSIALSPVVAPEGAEYTLSWTSSNTSVATVNSSGTVVARKKGAARITAKINGYNLSDYCNVTVSDYIRGDVNGDGDVSISDVTALITILLEDNSNNNPAADLNGDGMITISDLTELINLLLVGEDQVLIGDINGDGSVSIEDITALISYLISGEGSINMNNSDVDGNGVINIEDLTSLINLLLNGNT